MAPSGEPGLDRDHEATRTSYRELFERSADAILIIEGDRFVDCNDATVRMLRYESKEALLKTHPSELSPPTQPDGRNSFEKAEEIMALAFEQGSHRFEWDHVRADGEVFPVEVLLTAVREGDRKTLHVVWRDITDRKRLEAELRQTQKMEAIGKLAGGVAHDFNNLLVAILGNASLLRDTVVADATALARIEEILWAGERAAELVGQLLAFSRKQLLAPVVLDLNVVVHDLEKLFRRTLGEDIRLEMTPFERTLPVRADAVQLEQVVVNLVTNARDAIRSGGTIGVQTREEVIEEVPPDPRLSLPRGRYAVLTVTDDGCGMDEDTRRRAFDPFYTTKDVGEGTGLGLSMVYGTAKQTGGDVLVDSEPDRGTVVRVYLPVSSESLTATRARGRAAPARGGTETLLVVEDEPAVYRLIEKVLSRAGYVVILARDGVEALGRFEEHAGEIDLVLTDVVMPGMGGPEMVETLEKRGHAPRVLYASGYTADALQSRGFIEEGIDLLAKPYRPRDLLARVREALDREE